MRRGITYGKSHIVGYTPQNTGTSGESSERVSREDYWSDLGNTTGGSGRVLNAQWSISQEPEAIAAKRLDAP